MGFIRQSLAIAAALAISSTSFAARRAGSQSVIFQPNQPVRIATMDEPAFGFLTRNSVELAIRDFGGRLHGHKIQSMHYSKGCDVRTEIDGFIEGLIREAKTVGLVGPICSGRTARIAEMLGTAKVLTISPANTAWFLTEPDFRAASYYRTSPNDLYQGGIGASFARESLGASTAAIIHYGQDNEYSSLLANGFSQAFVDADGTVEAVFDLPFDTSDYSAVLDNLPPVDVVYAPIFTEDFANLYNQLRARGMTPLLGTDGAMAGYLFELLVDEGRDMYLSGLMGQGPGYGAFLSSYLAAYGEEPGLPFDPLAYDATLLMLMAAEAVAVVQANGGMTISRDAMIAYMDGQVGDSPYPYTGAGGVYDAPMNGDLNPDGFSVFRAANGEFAPVFP